MIHTIQPDIHSYQNVTQEPFSSGDPSPLHYCKTLIAFLFGLMCQKAAGSSSSLSRGAHLASEEPRIPPPPACPSIASLSSKPQQPSPHSHIFSLSVSPAELSSRRCWLPEAAASVVAEDIPRTFSVILLFRFFLESHS